MPMFKATILMQDTTGTSTPPQRQAGWTESWYFNGSLVGLKAALFGAPNPNQGGGGNWGANGLLEGRAALLPSSAAVVGCRIQTVNPVGPTTSFAGLLPGNPTWPTDYPSLCLLISVPALATRNVRRAFIRAIPDQFIVRGEYVPDGNFKAALSNYFLLLSDFAFRGRDLAQQGVVILGISAAGLVTLAVANNFLPGDSIIINRVKDAQGRTVSGTFTVASIGPGSVNFTIANWTKGVCTGGVATGAAYTFPNIDATGIQVGRIITRKVGRPFVAFRGRRSKRP